MLAWIEQNAHRELTLSGIADYAAMSVRTLNRRFQAETGQTPMQWVTGVRIRHAQELLERTSRGVERIGRDVGFTSAANFREQFRRLSGLHRRPTVIRSQSAHSSTKPIRGSAADNRFGRLWQWSNWPTLADRAQECASFGRFEG